jgi:hypothetical protein
MGKAAGVDARVRRRSAATCILTLTLSREKIAEITFFSDPSLVTGLGLPRQIE